MSSEWPLDWVRERLGCEPRDAALFRAALTHRSALGANNERLEFLGDAVLNLAVAQSLYRRHPRASEGDLSRLRARLVSREPLAAVALELGIGDALRLGSGELRSGGFRRESILADAFEALCGAVYLELGFETACALVERLLAARMDALPEPGSLKDPKTRLQELLQGRSIDLPLYTVVDVGGEPHAQHFQVRCEVPALGLSATGEGSSRRRAEQAAAATVLARIG